MRRTWSVAVARDPRQEATWQRVGEVMRSWTGDVTVTPVGEVMWMADTASPAVANALANAVIAVGAHPLRSSRTVFDEADYAAADLVGVFGIDLSLDPPFVRNTARAYRANPPCPQCGHRDAFDVSLVEPPCIDEAMLDHAAPDGSRPGPHGWEVVNLPDGGLLLSTRLITALRDAGVRYLATREVLDRRGATSARMAALRASVAVLAPCPRHSKVEGDPFCDVCGTAHGNLEGHFWMPRSTVGDAEVVSRHPGRASMLHVSPRVYAMLSGASGLGRGDPVRVCED